MLEFKSGMGMYGISVKRKIIVGKIDNVKLNAM
jgi:hypothetical protein